MNRSMLSQINNDLSADGKLTEKEIETFCNLGWWEDGNKDIFVDWDSALLNGVENLLFEDSSPVGELRQIYNILKRYDVEDGFYHA